MSGQEVRSFSREFKLAALRRLHGGEAVGILAAELGIRRKYLYEWRDRFRLGGALALRSCGRPTKAEILAMRSEEGPPGDPAGGLEVAPASEREELPRAQQRIAELERKIGQQQVELDFFQRALQQVREARQRSGVPGGTGSTRSSKR